MNRKDLNDYSLENGKYVYKGAYYAFPVMGRELVKIKRARLLLTALEILAFLVMGVFDNGQSRAVYVALPMVACALPAFMGAAAAFLTLGMDEKMTVTQYKRGPGRTRWCSVFALITGFMTLLGALVYSIAWDFAVADAPFIAAAALFVVCALIDTRVYAHCPAKRVL